MMALIDLNPYFHGTTNRIPPPFWAGSLAAIQAGDQQGQVVQASSMRRPSGKARGIAGLLARHFIRIVDGLKADVFGIGVGSTSLSNLRAGTHPGITMLQASTQRKR